MKPSLKRILSGMLSIAVAISAVPSVSTYADEVTVAYPYTLFASSGDEGAITVNADNFSVTVMLPLMAR
ncbi:MAG: hypothetical protein II695_11625 [Oscillospiraceae bacterium]|nr:hypothetical protein [Oscillospiraceae bacterium]